MNTKKPYEAHENLYRQMRRKGHKSWNARTTRHLDHWSTVLKVLRRSGFRPMLYRVNECRPEDPLSYLSAAAIRL